MRTLAAFLLLAGLTLADTPKPIATKPDEPVAASLDVSKAAGFLDGVALHWTRERKCMTCHTNVPYMLARPKVAGGDPKPMQEIRDFLEATVTGWETKKPKSDYDVVATAVSLAWNDSATTGKRHPATTAALDKMWTVQLKDGSFDWPECAWPPLEHDQFYGVAYAALGVALAPDGYRDTPAAKAGMDRIRAYIKAHPTKELHHRATLAWAGTKLDGLATADETKGVIAELRKLQRPDGGWNLPAMGPYPQTRNGEDNPMDVSDGFATGFATFVLRQLGVSADDPALKKSVEWLKSNQRQSGRWFTASPGGGRAIYVTNVGSAFAVLALDSCGVKLIAD